MLRRFNIPSDLRKIISDIIPTISEVILTKSKQIFTKSGSFFRKSQKIHTDYQALKKEVIPRMVQPPFLQCKDTTFFRRMQIRIFSREAQFCEILRQSAIGF